MKIGGVQVTGPAEEVLVLPRDPDPIVFRAIAVPDMEEFHKLCPEPKPSGKFVKGEFVPDEDSPDYQQALANYNLKRLAWMVINTLKPSEIEWDTVKADKPSTWPNWETDLRNAGLTQVEVNRVTQLVLDANSLNEDKLIKAREVFLRGRVQASVASCSQNSEPQPSPSGELAAESA